MAGTFAERASNIVRYTEFDQVVACTTDPTWWPGT
jgi:hypothetical protein